VYVLDFCCPERKLVVEVDGRVHDGQIAYDLARTEWLERFGYRVLRFRNEEVLSDLGTVLRCIRAVIGLR
jgi:very-short-patch-repair endonuclease